MTHNLEHLQELLKVETINEIETFYPTDAFRIPDSYVQAKRDYELLVKEFEKLYDSDSIEQKPRLSEAEYKELLDMYVFKLIEYSSQQTTKNKREAVEFALVAAIKQDRHTYLATKNYCDFYQISKEQIKLQSLMA